MWNEIRQLVPAAGEKPDFTRCLAAFPVLQHARTTPQSARFHGEGDVWTHTMMVIESLLGMADYRQASRNQQEILFLAALLHDVAKYRTTVVDPVTGHIGQPGHAGKGAVESRILLWNAGVPFAIREAVCQLIDRHQVPFYCLENDRQGHSPLFTVRALSWQLDIPLLAALAEADIMGRYCDDKNQVLDNIELFRELSREEGCYGQPRPFADPHTRVSYFRGASVHPDYPLFQPPGAKVTIMCGLPASGKDTWTQRHREGLPVVSFDDARVKLGLKYGDNDGRARQLVLEKARSLLRTATPFVWNATHLSRQMRSKTVDLCYSYGAEVEIVYLEQPRNELLRRNSLRGSTLSNKSLLGMLNRWQLPSPTEAHYLFYNL